MVYWPGVESLGLVNILRSQEYLLRIVISTHAILSAPINDDWHKGQVLWPAKTHASRQPSWKTVWHVIP
jgi:hypothetical protein